MSLKGVRHPLAAGPELIAPRVRIAIESAARGKFKLRFGGQTFSDPFAVGQRIVIGDVRDRIFLFLLYVAVRPGWMSPVRAFYIAPPLEMIVQRHRLIRRREHDRTSDEVFRWRIRKLFFSRCALGHGNITDSFNELLELFVSYFGLIHPKPIDVHAMPRT